MNEFRQRTQNVKTRLSAKSNPVGTSQPRGHHLSPYNRNDVASTSPLPPDVDPRQHRHLSNRARRRYPGNIRATLIKYPSIPSQYSGTHLTTLPRVSWINQTPGQTHLIRSTPANSPHNCAQIPHNWPLLMQTRSSITMAGGRSVSRLALVTLENQWRHRTDTYMLGFVLVWFLQGSERTSPTTGSLQCWPVHETFSGRRDLTTFWPFCTLHLSLARDEIQCSGRTGS
jgi:hypothetical protein